MQTILLAEGDEKARMWLANKLSQAIPGIKIIQPKSWGEALKVLRDDRNITAAIVDVTGKSFSGGAADLLATWRGSSGTFPPNRIMIIGEEGESWAAGYNFPRAPKTSVYHKFGGHYNRTALLDTGLGAGDELNLLVQWLRAVIKKQHSAHDTPPRS